MIRGISNILNAASKKNEGIFFFLIKEYFQKIFRKYIFGSRRIVSSIIFDKLINRSPLSSRLFSFHFSAFETKHNERLMDFPLPFLLPVESNTLLITFVCNKMCVATITSLQAIKTYVDIIWNPKIHFHWKANFELFFFLSNVTIDFSNPRPPPWERNSTKVTAFRSN